MKKTMKSKIKIISIIILYIVIIQKINLYSCEKNIQNNHQSNHFQKKNYCDGCTRNIESFRQQAKSIEEENKSLRKENLQLLEAYKSLLSSSNDNLSKWISQSTALAEKCIKLANNSLINTKGIM